MPASCPWDKPSGPTLPLMSPGTRVPSGAPATATPGPAVARLPAGGLAPATSGRRRLAKTPPKVPPSGMGTFPGAGFGWTCRAQRSPALGPGARSSAPATRKGRPPRVTSSGESSCATEQLQTTSSPDAPPLPHSRARTSGGSREATKLAKCLRGAKRTCSAPVSTRSRAAMGALPPALARVPRATQKVCSTPGPPVTGSMGSAATQASVPGLWRPSGTSPTAREASPRRPAASVKAALRPCSCSLT
mmetsp:Transcript_71990/g.232928  ORF Transcript_71990/g.232928 Transcript_71990/m.232928 type:complete len:247 (-) Transcript_71990:187-927(-)